LTSQFKVKDLIYVRYLDHVHYHREIAFAMKPQVREAIGWPIYDGPEYLTLCWDRDADPPTLRGGDPKASGLVLLKTDILDIDKLEVKNSERLNLQKNIVSTRVCASKPTKRKTQQKGET
jgi:hypothetical protein